MKKLIPNFIALFLLVCIFICSQFFSNGEMGYWDFLTYKYVLNIGVAGLGLMIGYGIKNYFIILAGATFSLAIYCLTFSFDSREIFTAFFLATYTVFLGFATTANLVRHFKDWLLTKEAHT